jgi:hypothetical protein
MIVEEAMTHAVKGFLETLAKFFVFLAIVCGWLVNFTLNGY